MKEYEIVATYLNGCSGAAHPQTSFEEAALEDTDAFLKARHGKDFDRFQKQTPEDGRILYTFNNGTVCYIYEFTEI